MKQWVKRSACWGLCSVLLLAGCQDKAPAVTPTETTTTAVTTATTLAVSDTTATETSTTNTGSTTKTTSLIDNNTIVTTQPTTTPTTLPSSSPTVDNEQNPLADAAVITQLDTIAADYNTVGLQVAVVKDGEVVGSHAYGWATKETDPMTVDHKIRIASVSKVVIGMAAMLAIEDGALELDADLGNYWNTTVRNPSYPDTPITMRHLLSHTSSITPLYGWDYSSRYDSIIERFAYHYNNTRPGSMNGYIYNNYGFHIAGSTIELATGTHMDDYLDTKLFNAMGIDAAFHSGDIQATDKLVTRYEADGSLVHTVEEQLAVHADEQIGGNGTHFSGGLTISAPDLAKLCALLANDGVYNGEQRMSPDSVATMETCCDGTWGDNIYQALPLCYHTDICGRDSLYYHSGYAHGVRSMFSYDPVEKDGVVILMVGADTGKNSYDFSNLAYEMSSYLYTLL